MSRALITPTVAPGPYAAAGIALNLQASDAGNHNYAPSTGRDLIVAYNTEVSTVRHVTINAAPDTFGRSVDIATEAIAAGAVRVWGPFPALGWKQADGSLYFTSDNASVKFAVIQLP